MHARAVGAIVTIAVGCLLVGVYMASGQPVRAVPAIRGHQARLLERMRAYRREPGIGRPSQRPREGLASDGVAHPPPHTSRPSSQQHAPPAGRVSAQEVLRVLEDGDYDLGDIGFPKRALSIEEARLCDRELQPWLKGSMYRCPDPTCLRCDPHDQNRKKSIMRMIRSDAIEGPRIAILKSKFSNASSVTLMTVNSGQLHLWLNWVCSCDANGIEVRSSTLMFPTDQEAYDIIVKNGFTALPLDWAKKLGFQIDSKYEGADGAGWNPHMQGHSDINAITIMIANDLIKLGHTVLIHDVDIVWKVDPRPWLFNAAIHRDCLTMFAPRWDALGVANSGFVWLKANRRTQVFIQTLENLLPIKGISDQQLWNAILRHPRFRQIGFRVLPLTQFQLLYDHTLRRWNQYKDKALVVHGVSHRKSYRLAKAGLWYFKEGCKAFDQKWMPCGGRLLDDSCKV